MRRQFPNAPQWDARQLQQMVRPEIGTGLARFIEGLPFFFIATASPDGACDCSFRGHEELADGTPLPALKVIDPRTIVFPDFPGNGLFNSLGNILVNPHIGMLFMDFARQRRARVNGRAGLHRANPAARAIWPMAEAVVTVEVVEAYGNCAARIPRLVPAGG